MKNRKLLRAAAALLLVGVVGVASVGCSFELEQPEWITQALCDHVFDEEEVLKEATCTEDGRVMKVCTDCGKTKITTVKATGHDVVEDEAVAGTCATPGLTAGSHCTACGEVIVKQEEVYAHKDVNHDGKCDYCSLSKFEPGYYFLQELSPDDNIITGKWYSGTPTIRFTDEDVVALSAFYPEIMYGYIKFEDGATEVYFNDEYIEEIALLECIPFVANTDYMFIPETITLCNASNDEHILSINKWSREEGYSCCEIIFAPGYDW